MQKKRSINRSKLNLYIDLGMALFFAVVMEERFTGLHIHEILGLAIAAVLITHIILHWRWVVSITKTFFERFFHETRLNYVLNLALFIDVVIAIVSGVLVSRTLGWHFGLAGTTVFNMEIVHSVSSYLSLMLVGAHVALHWKWIITHSRKYLIRNPLPQHKTALSNQTAAASAQHSSHITVS